MPEPQTSAPLIEIAGIALCILMSALFSGSETALTSLTESRILDLINDPKRWGTRRLAYWLNHNTRILTSLLIGNNLVNIAASILGAKVAYRYLGSYADAAAIGIMTFLILIFGEVFPKTLGKLAYDKLAPVAMLFALMVDRFFYVLAWPLNWLTRRALRHVGSAGSTSAGPGVTEGEIRHMIQLAVERGVIDKNWGKLMRSAVRFKNIIASDIMVPHGRMVALAENADLQKVFEVAVTSGYSRIPVYREKPDNIEGILYTKDLIPLCRQAGPGESAFRDLVRRPPFFVPETKKVNQLLTEMQKKRVHMAIVVDEFGSTSGLITMEDILEELVGEIRDEYDEEEAAIRKSGDTAWEAYAWTPIRELGEALGAIIPDNGRYETLGGFLIDIHGSVPAKGHEIKWGNFKFTITESDTKKISKVKIDKLI